MAITSSLGFFTFLVDLAYCAARRSNCGGGGGCSEAKWCSSKAQGSVQVCSNQATITWDSTHDIFPATNIIFQYSSAFMIIVTTAVHTTTIATSTKKTRQNSRAYQQSTAVIR